MPNPQMISTSRWWLAVLLLVFLFCASCVDRTAAQCPWNNAPRSSQATTFATAISTSCDPTVTLTWAGLTCADFTNPTCQVEFFEYCQSADNFTCDSSITVAPLNQMAAIAGSGVATITGLEYFTTYTFFVRAGNCMGNSSWISTSPLTIYPDELPDKGGSTLMITQGDDCQHPRMLALAWTPFQHVNPVRSEDYYEYCVTSESEPVCQNWTVTKINTATVYVESNDTYHVAITAFNCAGEANDTLVGSVRVTSPQVPDSTGGSVTLLKTSVPPNCIPQLNAAGTFTNFFPIGTNHYEYCFGTSSSTCDLQNITSSVAPVATMSGLQNNVTYYARFRLANCMGYSNWVESPGVYISGLFPDGSECCEPAPLAPSVALSEMDPCITPRQAQISFSGIVGFRYSYEYCIVNSEQAPSNCSDHEVFTTTEESEIVMIESSNTYWAVVRTSNCAGNSSWSVSNSIFSGTENAPITTDSTRVFVEQEFVENHHCLETVSAQWEGFQFADNRTYVGPYEVCLSSTHEPDCDILEWTSVEGTQFVTGVCGNVTHYFHVKASNCEGTSDVVTSDPFMFNSSTCDAPPSFNASTLEISNDMVEFVCNGTKVIVTVAINTTLDSIHNNTDNTTGFSYCVTSTESAEDCLFSRDWTEIADAESWNFNITFTLENLSTESAFLRVRAFNCIGAAAWTLVPIEIDLPHECHQDASTATSTVIITTLSTMAVTAATIGAVLFS